MVENKAFKVTVMLFLGVMKLCSSLIIRLHPFRSYKVLNLHRPSTSLSLTPEKGGKRYSNTIINFISHVPSYHKQGVWCILLETWQAIFGIIFHGRIAKYFSLVVWNAWKYSIHTHKLGETMKDGSKRRHTWPLLQLKYVSRKPTHSPGIQGVVSPAHSLYDLFCT